MKTCCGCLNTKSGTMTVLLLYTVLYITGIVSLAIYVGSGELETSYKDLLKEKDTDCTQGEHKDTWWCEGIQDTKDAVEGVMIVSIILCSIFLICSILAIFGTSKGSHWFLMPWVVAKFILLAIVAVVMTLSIILLSVYPPKDGDSSYVIAFGVIAAAFTAFLFYLWLCVVSHFQILREVSALGLSDLEHVKPFTNEPDNDSMLYTEEYPTSYNDQKEDKESVLDVDDDEALNHEYDPVKEHVNSRPASANVVAPAPPPVEYNAPDVDIGDAVPQNL